MIDNYEGNRRGTSEELVNPLRRQHGEVVCGQLDDPFIISPIKVRLLQPLGGDDTELPVPERTRDLQRSIAGRDRVVELSELRVDIREEGTDTSAPAIVAQL